MGAVIDPASYAIFAPLVGAPPYDDVTVDQDVAYGTDPAQRLDVYSANGQADGEERPVLLFVHGGGFTGGRRAGDYYPQNITAWGARNGMVGVNIDYRLAPGATWPAARDDLAQAIGWVRENIARYGGDPQRIVLWGHSAGANHVADYVQHADLQGSEAPSVIGALLLSPAYMAEPGAEVHAYYGSDSNLQTAAPAIERLGRSRIPLMLAYAEFDPPPFQAFARAAGDTLCAEGGTLQCPRIVRLSDHNHLTEGAAVGSVDQSLTGPLLAWMEEL